MEQAAILTAVGVLVALTNIIVEVGKKLTWDKLPTNVLAVIVAQVLTVGAGIAWHQAEGAQMAWYTIAGLVVAGFAVAYAAMFGFDKLKEALDWGNQDGSR